MKLQHKLSEHPFYQMWQKGEITNEQLSKYAYSYMEFIEKIPEYWQKSITGLNVNEKYSEELIKEENEHTELWKGFKSKFNCNEFPDMRDVNNNFSKMNPSELLGAIHSFEIQQPEVAKTKKEGLLKYYGFNESVTKYFDEHLNEAEHIAFGKMLSEKYADKNDFEKGFNKGAEIVYNALDRFLV